MYPKRDEQLECLQPLVGTRTFCSTDVYPFYIEDIEGVDKNSLASMAKASNLSGKDFAEQIINASAREMLGDIELMMNNGYKLNDTIGNICSTCKPLAVYTVNSGIIVKNVLKSNYMLFFITQLQILINQSGEKEFKIDDGLNPKTFKATFTAGVIQPVLVNYSTKQPSVKIYFTDSTIGLGQIQCETPSSCGCGTSVVTPISISGLLAGNEASTQYGFIPCAVIGCSYETLICQLVTAMPRLLGLTLLYKVAEKIYLNKSFSNRNNDTVSFNEENSQEVTKNYGMLYWARMTGTKDGRSKGVKHAINEFLAKNRGDKCVNCDSKITISGAAG